MNELAMIIGYIAMIGFGVVGVIWSVYFFMEIALTNFLIATRSTHKFLMWVKSERLKKIFPNMKESS